MVEIIITNLERMIIMKPNILWWIAAIVAIVGILMFEKVVYISQVSSFWMEVVAAGLFAISALFKK